MVPFEEVKSQQPLFDQVAMNETYLKKDVISDKSVKNAVCEALLPVLRCVRRAAPRLHISSC